MNKTYLKLPYLLQFLLVNAFGLQIKFKRYNKDFNKALKEFCEVDRKESCGLDIKRVMEVIKESTFYPIKDEQDFYSRPILTKEMIKKNYDKIINHNYVFKYFHTSGTTGSGLKFPVSREFLAQQWAIFWKFRFIHGITTKTWCAYMIGKNILDPDRRKGPYWIKSYATRQLLFSGAHLNKNTVQLYLKRIKKSKYQWMHGYPSTLNYLAALIQECGLEAEAKDLNMRIITTSSETLYEFQKKNIERIFGCKVRQLYGLTEGVANIFECEEGSLHIDETFSYVEFIKEENSCNDYKIIGTTYSNKAFPLVRYDTGDTVKLYEDEKFICPCGRKSRVVKEIIGREQDYIVLEDGTKVGGSGFFFKKVIHVSRAQIYQKKMGEAIFFVIKEPGYTEEEENILREEIINRFGKNFRYEIRYTNELIRLKNGKTKFVINEVDNCRAQYTDVVLKTAYENKTDLSPNLINNNMWKDSL